GSIAVGKLADFVELSADPYKVDVGTLTNHVQVLGTWLHGHKIDLDSFIAEVEQIDPSKHQDLPEHATRSKCC
ncbi:MAG: hypothetical protein QG671_4298, partial [Actinomycetota bacterium]|nr:hypothetical protein [Actinomycetota bacterium]